MSSIITLCDRIIGQLTSKGSPIAQLLKPGLAVSKIHELESGLPIVLPSSCVELYTWHNGTESESGSTFCPWWIFDTLEDSLERYSILTECDGNSWDSRWFPLFSSSDISSVGIACGSVRESDGPIHCFDYTASSRHEFLSLEKMLETILVACERDIIWWNADEKELDQDDERFEQLASELNPGLTRWPPK